MEVLRDIGSFVIALGILVTIHEFGHFYVARKLGVKVLTFSVGFGKPLIQRVGKDGVRYVLGAFPLGGYVKMLGEQQDEDQEALSEEEKKAAFNRKSVWVRMAIVLAGPAANFILAIILYWIINLNGLTGLIPVIAQPEKGTIAAAAGLNQGDKIISVDGVNTKYYQDVNLRLVRRIGEVSTIALTIQPKGSSRIKDVTLDIAAWKVHERRPDALKSLGLNHIVNISLIDNVTPDSAADKAGIYPGDQIMTIEGKNAKTWRQMSKLLTEMPNKEVTIEVLRNDELIAIPVVIGSQDHNGKMVGHLGVAKDYKPYFLSTELGVYESLERAFSDTARMIELTVGMFKKFLFGDISHKSLSGLPSIAQGAGNSASMGILVFLGFLAVISVNLGFINLLPIPMLDGGHFLYFLIEAVTGKPLPEEVQAVGLQFGLILIVGLMIFVNFNDLSQFIF